MIMCTYVVFKMALNFKDVWRVQWHKVDIQHVQCQQLDQTCYLYVGNVVCFFFSSNGVWIISRRVLRCHSVLHSIVLFNLIWCLGHTPDQVTLQVNRFCATMLNSISQNIMPITHTLVDCLRKVPIACFPFQSQHPCIYILPKQGNNVSRMVSANPNMANISWCDFFQMHICTTVFIRYTTANHSNGVRYHHFYFTVVIPRFEWARLYLNVAHNMLISWIYMQNIMRVFYCCLSYDKQNRTYTR